ncbi:hypothetical protein B0H67DRAFT_265765 [Lasiosphaeris hirsuta]|uniref:Rhodopsin domain-containing protein n=1 Tax=Lasiosphaeris hirsuta TaxID=260670 RepID=A0AA40A7X5_9PEZI|nr:hypothetical protein B0H67DRAFT_265765 [Lasiosphaeris hirsuta]
MSSEGGVTTDNSVGLATLAVVVPLFTLAIIVYSIRIRTRMRPKYRLNAADYTITIAFLAEALSIALTIAAVANGFGRPAQHLSDKEKEIIGITTFIVFIVAFWASSFSRISVACLLLQFTPYKVWRALLWTTIVLQVVLLISCDIVELVQCRPIRAIWADVDDAECLPAESLWNSAYGMVAFGMFSDALFAVQPMLIIWRLSRSPVEKVLISVLLSLGLLAVGTGVVKILTMKTYDNNSDNVMGDMMPLYLWTRIEETVLIIAACAPLLKSPIEGMLHRRLGLPGFSPMVRYLNTVDALPSISSSGKQPVGWYWSSRGSSLGTDTMQSRASSKNCHVNCQ